MAKHCFAVLLIICSSLVYGDETLPGGNAGQNIEEWFDTISRMSPANLAAEDGRLFSFAVDLDNSPGFSIHRDVETASFTLLYRMAYNNVTEGWSWEALANPDTADYYRFKFLPLKSVLNEMAQAVELELYPGKWLKVRNLRRYDYFLAFENLYDFYPRKPDDDAGFGATFKMDSPSLPQRSQLKMLAVFRLKAPYHAESNTFWKADFSDPVDFTLRKRYLIGELEELRFVDSLTGHSYARQRRLAPSMDTASP